MSHSLHPLVLSETTRLFADAPCPNRLDFAALSRPVKEFIEASHGGIRGPPGRWRNTAASEALAGTREPSEGDPEFFGTVAGLRNGEEILDSLRTAFEALLPCGDKPTIDDRRLGPREKAFGVTERDVERYLVETAFSPAKALLQPLFRRLFFFGDPSPPNGADATDVCLGLLGTEPARVDVKVKRDRACPFAVLERIRRAALSGAGYLMVKRLQGQSTTSLITRSNSAADIPVSQWYPSGFLPPGYPPHASPPCPNQLSDEAYHATVILQQLSLQIGRSRRDRRVWNEAAEKHGLPLISLSSISIILATPFFALPFLCVGDVLFAGRIVKVEELPQWLAVLAALEVDGQEGVENGMRRKLKEVLAREGFQENGEHVDVDFLTSSFDRLAFVGASSSTPPSSAPISSALSSSATPSPPVNPQPPSKADPAKSAVSRVSGPEEAATAADAAAMAEDACPTQFTDLSDEEEREEDRDQGGADRADGGGEEMDSTSTPDTSFKTQDVKDHGDKVEEEEKGEESLLEGLLSALEVEVLLPGSGLELFHRSATTPVHPIYAHSSSSSPPPFLQLIPHGGDTPPSRLPTSSFAIDGMKNFVACLLRPNGSAFSADHWLRRDRLVAEARIRSELRGVGGILPSAGLFESEGGGLLLIYQQRSGVQPFESWEELAKFREPVLAALDEVHERGYTLRQVNPRCFGRSADGAVSVVEFKEAAPYKYYECAQEWHAYSDAINSI